MSDEVGRLLLMSTFLPQPNLFVREKGVVSNSGRRVPARSLGFEDFAREMGLVVAKIFVSDAHRSTHPRCPAEGLSASLCFGREVGVVGDGWFNSA
jgi:hypothetical protein